MVKVLKEGKESVRHVNERIDYALNQRQIRPSFLNERSEVRESS